MTRSDCCDFFINNAIVIKATMKPTQVKQIIEEKIALLLLCQQVLLAEVWRSGVKSVSSQHLVVSGQVCTVDLP